MYSTKGLLVLGSGSIYVLQVKKEEHVPQKGMWKVGIFHILKSYE